NSAIIIGGSKKAILKGFTIANAVCLARDIENRPGNVATPSHLAENAKSIGKSANMKVTIFERDEFTKMGMGALSGVASGTEIPPKFIIIEYMGGPKSQKPKILVGKGLTFDSGGISIKPASKMDEMKYDMCGAGVVLGVMKTISELKPKMNIIGIIPSTENMSGDKAYRPGDILKAYNGKTIEVLNTDAEGRLILADALSYASKHYDPEFILDFATLTGAVVVALGHVATGIMGTDGSLIEKIKSSSEVTGEKVWEFPLWTEYLDQVKSKIADVKNLGAPGQAGSIAGGAFLNSFVQEDIPWCHFDIAGSAWGNKDLPYQNNGLATGEMIRLVVDLIGI
ncbi:MAG: aminopeptidase, partial [Candidatus Marinimicrobia bacterium]|nr:aminopeptidase [Candidatus Neomarinimicrobiota bacterium]